MSEKKFKLSPNHASVKKKEDTIEQIRLRIHLLNECISKGVPKGFIAYKSLKSILDYSDSNKIRRITYPAVYTKDSIKIIDIDSTYKGEKNKTTNCKDYILQKLRILKNKSNKNALKIYGDKKDKKKSLILSNKELKRKINEQAALISSLAKELIHQRQQNNTLVTHIKQSSPNSNRFLEPYYKEYQQKLCEVRCNITPNIKKTLDTLQQLINELDVLYEEKSTGNVVNICDRDN